MKRPTWEDVKHLCYPGSTTDVPCWVARKNIASYVLYADSDGCETFLTLANGMMINALDYEAPLGWEPFS